MEIKPVNMTSRRKEKRIELIFEEEEKVLTPSKKISIKPFKPIASLTIHEGQEVQSSPSKSKQSSPPPQFKTKPKSAREVSVDIFNKEKERGEKRKIEQPKQKVSNKRTKEVRDKGPFIVRDINGIINQLYTVLNTAKYSVIISSPFITSRALLHGNLLGKINCALARGVALTVFHDVTKIDSGLELLKNSFRKYSKFSVVGMTNLHSKVLIRDDDLYISGSFNWLSGQVEEGALHRDENEVVVMEGNINREKSAFLLQMNKHQSVTAARKPIARKPNKKHTYKYNSHSLTHNPSFHSFSSLSAPFISGDNFYQGNSFVEERGYSENEYRSYGGYQDSSEGVDGSGCHHGVFDGEYD